MNLPVETFSSSLVWDLRRERPTLGGALVLRQEGELLAELGGRTSLDLAVIGSTETRRAVELFKYGVFGSSEIDFRIVDQPESQYVWPSSTERERDDFSYFSFTRLIDLYRVHGILPRLRWNQPTRSRAQSFRHRFSGCLICVHLKNVPPYLPVESNADGAAWSEFFDSRASEGGIEFVLVGSDPLPAGLVTGRGVTHISEIGLDLAGQLALISQADGFIGMASGVCTVANLSETPHVIFKHPQHHTLEMQRELGSADRFPFATERQRIWRTIATAPAIDEALELILH